MRILKASFWGGLGIGCIILLAAAIHKKESQPCKGVDIQIKDVSNNFFVDKKDILNTIAHFAGTEPIGVKMSSINLKLIEKALEKNVWIKAAELYFDNNAVLHVLITEREPVARIFDINGGSFYIDSSLARLPLSSNFSARVPVFTGFPSDRIILSGADSLLLKDVNALSCAIQKDSFRMAMVEQIDITAQRTFEMIPKIGNQIIIFGDAADMEEKFDKLQLFYANVMSKTGLGKYSIINLQYKNQIVAKKKDAEDVAANTQRTVQIMQMIAANAAKRVSDSVQTIMQDTDNNTADSSIIQQSIQREEGDDAGDNNMIEEKKATINPVILLPVTPPTNQSNSKETKKVSQPKKTVEKAPEKKDIPKKVTGSNDSKAKEKQKVTKSAGEKKQANAPKPKPKTNDYR